MRSRTRRATLLLAALALLLASLFTAGANASISPSSNTVTVGAGQTGTENKVVSVPAVPPKADIEIAIDTTGSMGGAIDQAKAEATNLVNAVQAQIPDAQFSVVEFKDAGDIPEYLVHNPMTGDAGTVQASINSLSASGGGDTPEAYNLVFNQAYNPLTGGDIGWRDGARRFVVVMGDAPPHGADAPQFPACADSSTDPNGLNTATELAGLAAAQRTLFMVAVNTFGILPCYQQLVAGGFLGSAAVELGSSFSDQMVALINAASAQVADVHLAGGSGGPAPADASWLSFSPASTGPVNAPSDVPFTVNIAVPSGTPAGSYTFDIGALADGVDIGHQTLTVVVPAPSSGGGTTTTPAPVTPEPTTPPATTAAATVRAAVAGVPHACVSSRFTVRVRVGGTATSVRVRVLVDGKVVARSTRRSFTVVINAKALKAGRHRVVVQARGGGQVSTKRVSFRRCAPVRPTLTG